MRVRQEQLDALAAVMRRPFLVELEQHIRRCYPEITWDTQPDRMQAGLEEATGQALQFDVTLEPDVALFVGLVFQIGRRFHLREEFAWTHHILRSTDLSGSEKVHRIFDILHGTAPDEPDREVSQPGDLDDVDEG